jgi:hypothetical protein
MSTCPVRRFEIVYYTHDDDSYFYSDTDYYLSVASVETGDELLSYSGYWNSRRDGDVKDGTESVEFTESGDAIVSTSFDGKVERDELPTVVELVDGGRAIRLTFRDGKTETRERRAVTIFTKYGQPLSRPLVGEPKDPAEAPGEESS